MRNRWPQLNLLFINVVLLIWVIIPYLEYNQALQWDAPGHLFNSWYLAKHLFPAMTGWNPYFFGGFPQGVFYPPLFHYLVAFLSFGITLTVAFKVVVAASILSIPLSSYCFFRAQDFSSRLASTACTGVLAIISLPIVYSAGNNSIGGTLYSTLNIGLVANAFALPLFFLYGAFLAREYKARKIIIPSLIFSSIVLSHTLTAIAAASWLVVFALFKVRNRADLQVIAKHIGLSFLLTCFWVIPFLLYFGYTDTVKIPLQLGPNCFILVFLCLAAIVTRFVRDAHISCVEVFFLVVTCLLLAVNLFGIQLHVYRLILFALVISPPIVFSLIPDKFLGTLTCIIYFAGAGTFFIPKQDWERIDPIGPQPTRQWHLPEPLANRTWVLSTWAEQLSPHINQMMLPMVNNFQSIAGLFVESSLNSRFLLAAGKLIDPDSMHWGVPVLNVTGVDDTATLRIIRRMARIFAINGLLSAKDLSPIAPVRAADIYSYDSSVNYYSVTSPNGELLRIREFDDHDYFTVSGPYLVLVRKLRGNVVFYFFALPEHIHHKTILEADHALYFCRSIYRDIFAIDFVAPESEAAPGTAPLFGNLRNIISEIIIAKEDRQKLNNEISIIENLLRKAGFEKASKEYSDAETVHLGKLFEVSLPAKLANLARAQVKTPMSLYDISGGPIIEALTTPPSTQSSNWREWVLDWFYNAPSDAVLSDSKLPFMGPFPQSQIRDLAISESFDEIKFKIDSASDVPILVKISYFPRWHAFIGSKEIQIYRAAPNVMLIFAKGNVKLSYQLSRLEKVLSWISSLTMISSVLLVLRQLIFKENSMG